MYIHDLIWNKQHHCSHAIMILNVESMHMIKIKKFQGNEIIVVLAKKYNRNELIVIVLKIK